jgi:hypothetical protein
MRPEFQTGDLVKFRPGAWAGDLMEDLSIPGVVVGVFHANSIPDSRVRGTYVADYVYYILWSGGHEISGPLFTSELARA